MIRLLGDPMITAISAHKRSILADILVFSAWGFIIVAGSLLLFWVGLFVDEKLLTKPYFMFGLFFLAIFLAIGRLWQRAVKVKDSQKASLIPENERKALRNLSKTGISLGQRW
jgi:uncharacterized membrane protein YbhN (UPF0104 family)